MDQIQPTSASAAVDDDAGGTGQTRQTIFNAAKELVARKGPGTTVRNITEASGANGAAVNYYFQSKDNLVRLATEAITGDVNRERLLRLDALESAAAGSPLRPRQILETLIEPVLDVSRSEDGGSLYVRSVFQMRVDARAEYHSFSLNGHVAQRFVAAICRTYPGLARKDAIWHYECARGAAIHMLANLDPVSRRFELLEFDSIKELPEELTYRLDRVQVERIIDIILCGFGRSPD